MSKQEKTYPYRDSVGNTAPPRANHFFNGWKEIASYLGKGVRTCQRYEREMGLPIRRPAGESSPAVMAVQAELDKWVSAPHLCVDSALKCRPLISRTNKLRADFLQIDSEIALTFSGIALTSVDPNTKRRTAQAARRAYHVIMSLRKGTVLSEAERDKLKANLRRLKSELHSLGQNF